MERFYENVNGKQKLNLNKVAEEISKQHKLIYFGNTLYEYKNGFYQKLDNMQIRQWVKQLLA